MVDREVHISSLVVHVIPQDIGWLSKTLSHMDNLEIALLDEHAGKIVVVLETDLEQTINLRIQEIQSLPSVLNVAMVFHHCEPISTMEEILT